MTATNRTRSQGHVKTPDHILVSDLPNRSKRDRVAPIDNDTGHTATLVPLRFAKPFCLRSLLRRRPFLSNQLVHAALARLGLPRNPRFAAPCYSQVAHKNRRGLGTPPIQLLQHVEPLSAARSGLRPIPLVVLAAETLTICPPLSRKNGPERPLCVDFCASLSQDVCWIHT